MAGFKKVSDEEYAGMPARTRIRAWKWWFLLLLLLGAIAAIFAFLREAQNIPRFGSLPSVPVMLAFATTGGTAAAGQTGGQPPDSAAMKSYVMMGILALIAVITLVCLYVSLFSKNPAAAATAGDLLKTCLGFFIGIVTSYLGPTS